MSQPPLPNWLLLEGGGVYLFAWGSCGILPSPILLVIPRFRVIILFQHLVGTYCLCLHWRLNLLSLLVTWCTNSLTFNNCTLWPKCIYVFCIYRRTNSDLCHLQHKLIGFYNRDEKCLLRGTGWVFKWSSLHFICKGVIMLWWILQWQEGGHMSLIHMESARIVANQSCTKREGIDIVQSQ